LKTNLNSFAQSTKATPKHVEIQEIQPDNMFRMTSHQMTQSSPLPANQTLSLPQNQASFGPQPGFKRGTFQSTDTITKLRAELLNKAKTIQDYEAQLANSAASQMDLHHVLHKEKSDRKDEVMYLNRYIAAMEEAHATIEQRLESEKLEKQFLMEKNQGVGHLFGLLLWKIFSIIGLWVLGALKRLWQEIMRTDGVEGEDLVENEVGMERKR
jgi:hypothetical protein